MEHDGLDLYERLYEAIEDADRCVANFEDLGISKAQAERDYRMAKRKRILYERGKGTPVTVIGDIVKGAEDISELAFARDCAEALYDANREALNVAKRKIDIAREQIAREWGAR